MDNLNARHERFWGINKEIKKMPPGDEKINSMQKIEHAGVCLIRAEKTDSDDSGVNKLVVEIGALLNDILPKHKND